MKRVYANDNTVYIVAQTKGIVTKNPGSNCIVISGVESVTTGMRNVNLSAWNPAKVQEQTTEGKTIADAAALDAAHIAYGAYTLFNDKGNVIATVVVGEDDGNTSNYAFVHSDNLVQEDYSDDADKWTWHRKVIVNGEEVTLTEKGTANPEIANRGNSKGGKMAQGEWFEVKYDANGNVRHVNQLGLNDVDPLRSTMPEYDFTGPDTKDNTKYLDDMNDVEGAVDNNKNSIVLWQDLTDTTYKISSNGNTLHIDNKSAVDITRGIDMSPDAKIVLLQDTIKSNGKGHKYMGDQFIGTWVGGSGAASAVKQLNGNLTGYVGAVFENGVATSVIIWDMKNTIINVGDYRPGDDGDDDSVLGISDDGTGTGNLIYKYYDGDYKPNEWQQVREDAANAVADYYGVSVAKNNIKGTSATGSETGIVMLDDGSLKGEAVSVEIQRMIKVTEDGKLVKYIQAADYSAASADIDVRVSQASAKYLLADGVKAIAATGAGAPTAPYSSDASKDVNIAADLTSGKDINLVTAYDVTLTTITGKVGNIDLYTGANANLVAKDAVVSLTGADPGATRYCTFTEDGTQIAASQKKIDNGGHNTYSYTVTKDTTLAEVAGVLVKVAGTNFSEVHTNGSVTFPYTVNNAKFAHDGAGVTNGVRYASTSEVTVTAGVTGYTFTLAIGTHDADGDGVVNLTQVAVVTATGAKVTAAKVKYHWNNSGVDTATAITASGDLIKVGTRLDLEGTAVASENVQLDINGASADADVSTYAGYVADSAVEGTAAVTAKASYTIQSTDYDLDFTQG